MTSATRSFPSLTPPAPRRTVPRPVLLAAVLVALLGAADAIAGASDHTRYHAWQRAYASCLDTNTAALESVQQMCAERADQSLATLDR
ncbi:MAG: hypothetical protein WB493_04535 [Anaeromyxobacteraceae bacterium]